MKAGLFILLSCLLLSSQVSAQDEELVVVDSAPVGATDEEIATTLALPEIAELAVPAVLNFEPADLAELAKKAKAAHASLTLTNIDKSKTYDIVIQAGHYPRKAGATGGEGRYVNEQEIGAWVAQMLTDKLTEAGVAVALIPADGYPNPLNTKIFLAFHTDATDAKCVVGPSVGYDSKDDTLGMHFIAATLAISLGIDPDKFMKDSYTKNLKGYYAFKHMDTSSFEGVLEMSELTCPKQEENLLGNAAKLAENLTVAVRFALRSSSS